MGNLPGVRVGVLYPVGQLPVFANVARWGALRGFFFAAWVYPTWGRVYWRRAGL